MYTVTITDFNGKSWSETAENLNSARKTAEDCFGEDSSISQVEIYSPDGELAVVYDENGEEV